MSKSREALISGLICRSKIPTIPLLLKSVMPVFVDSLPAAENVNSKNPEVSTLKAKFTTSLKGLHSAVRNVCKNGKGKTSGPKVYERICRIWDMKAKEYSEPCGTGDSPKFVDERGKTD